jgi:hypothetical protein
MVVLTAPWRPVGPNGPAEPYLLFVPFVENLTTSALALIKKLDQVNRIGRKGEKWGGGEEEREEKAGVGRQTQELPGLVCINVTALFSSVPPPSSKYWLSVFPRT